MTAENITLLKKLETIHMPKIKDLPTGEASTVEELWDKLIISYIPSKEAIIKWHNLLLGYINKEDATFAIRFFNNTPKDRYDDLRRGFLTKTNQGYSFFYTDNFFAAYFQKMAIDNFVPSIDEFLDAFNNRRFPSRFGRNTSNERALLAVPQGKDPGIGTAGFKLAHIVDVGRNYYFEDKNYSLREIVAKYFPGGNRSDWRDCIDNNGKYKLRNIDVSPDAKKFIIAHFLRFVHPFNYFLAPKRGCEENMKCRDIAEYLPLINHAYEYNLNLYGSIYTEYLKLIMASEAKRDYYPQDTINIKYGLKEEKYNKEITSDKNNVVSKINKISNLEEGLRICIVWEYLTNPNTSFRKIEREYLNIESQARGGGFVAKDIINKMGVVAAKKGVLSKISIEDEIRTSSGEYKQILITINSMLEENNV